MEDRKIPDVAAEAEAVVQKLPKDRYGNIALKTSQLRRFLSAVNAVTNRIMVYHARHLDERQLPLELASEVKYLKVKFAYQAGRMREVQKSGGAARIKGHSGATGGGLER